MFNSAFDGVGAKPGDLLSGATARRDRDAQRPYLRGVNNGVYQAGFAITQQAYEEAIASLFETLDWLEDRLSRSRFLCGDDLTEADIRLFPTLVRFDPVYVGHFKCNVRRLVDYRHLWAYTRDLYQWLGIASTVNYVPHQTPLLLKLQIH